MATKEGRYLAQWKVAAMVSRPHTVAGEEDHERASSRQRVNWPWVGDLIHLDLPGLRVTAQFGVVESFLGPDHAGPNLQAASLCLSFTLGHSRTAHVAEFRIPPTLAPLTAHDITPGGGAPGGHGDRCEQAQSRAIGVVACGPRSDQARREAGNRSIGEPAGRREGGGAGGSGVFLAGPKRC